MSDGLFLLLAVSCMYLTRRKLYVPACVVGFFAAFARVPGLLLLVPVCFELVGDLVRDVRVGAQGRRFVLSAVGRCLSLLLIPLGFGLFLFLNYRLTGDWFRFLQYQQENWSQSMGWFSTRRSIRRFMRSMPRGRALRRSTGCGCRTSCTCLARLRSS